MASQGSVRIGELARRTGVSPELLRAWEQRYGLLRPTRSQGGFRLYTDEDEQRVRAMRTHIGEGLSAAEAASRALTDEPVLPPASGPAVAEIGRELRDALDDFDNERAHAALDRLLATVSIEAALAEVVLPYLRDLGDRWSRGEASVAQEHFASNLIRGRLLGLARDWSRGAGSAVVLACPPGEEHDLGLIVFGLAAARRGCRIIFLGADTPIDTIADAVAATHSATLVLATSRVDPLRTHRGELRELASHVRVLVCGTGASADDVAAMGGEVLAGGPLEAAIAIT